MIMAIMCAAIFFPFPQQLVFVIVRVAEEFPSSALYLFLSMSAHEGVSCDACGKSNFRFKRYKCLICYDYDLCSNCYEQSETSSQHAAEHPMQCKIFFRYSFSMHVSSF